MHLITKSKKLIKKAPWLRFKGSISECVSCAIVVLVNVHGCALIPPRKHLTSTQAACAYASSQPASDVSKRSAYRAELSGVECLRGEEQILQALSSNHRNKIISYLCRTYYFGYLLLLFIIIYYYFLLYYLSLLNYYGYIIP